MVDIAGFLGGVAKQRALDRTQAQDEKRLGLEERRVSLGERQGEFAQRQAIMKEAQERLAETAAEGERIITAARQVKEKGGNPAPLRRSLELLAQSAAPLPNGKAIGQRMLSRFEAEIGALPDPATAAQTAGQADAAGMLSKAKALRNAGLPESAAMKTAGIETPTMTAQSKAGQQVLDRLNFVREYGENSPQVQAFDEAATGEDKPKLSDVRGVRQEFTKASGEFVTVRDAFGRIAAATENPSAAGDLATIFGFMKLMDPGSVVREGEFATAQNSAGVPTQIRNLYNKIITGERLSPEQREDFIAQAENLFAVQLGNQRRLENQFRGLAERQNMDPDNVVVDFLGPYREADAVRSRESAPRIRVDMQGNIIP